MSLANVKATIDRVASQQKLAVLSTIKNGRPYSNLVAFLADSDLDIIYFTTPRFTRKYQNIKETPLVSVFIDNRENSSEDFQDTVAINAMGRAELKELVGKNKDKGSKMEHGIKFPENIRAG